MPFELWYTAVLLILMTVLLISEWLEMEVTTFLVLVLLMAGEVITVSEAFSGIANEGVLTIALLFVIAGVLNNSGILSRLTRPIFGRRSAGISRKLLRILFPVSLISAFMNNTPVVAMMIPVLRNWADKYHYSPSKYLIPISYAAILGGMCTLIGTSTNLIIHGLMRDYGLQGIDFFEISKIGVPAALVGILFIVFAAPHLLPDRRELLVELGENTREFVIELKVTADYEHIGKTIEEAGLRHLKGLFLFQIERNGEILAPARPEEKILLGDRFFFIGIPRTIIELQRTPGLRLTRDTHFDLKQYDSNVIKTFECVISGGSPLVGKSVRESRFRSKYEAVILAIHRQGERIRKKIGDIVLKPGDTLLLLADRKFRNKWYYAKDFYLIAGAVSLPSKPLWKGYLSLAVFAVMILMTSLHLLPLLAAAAFAVAALFLARCVDPSEARTMIDFRVLLIIAFSLGIAAGVQKSGLAAVLAEHIAALGSILGTFGVLAAVYALTSIYTLFIAANAAAAIIFPIAFSAATALQADSHAFAIAVMIAAAASFATPIGYQTNLMVYGPGRYTFNDFLKLGIPLQFLTGVVALLLINHFYL